MKKDKKSRKKVRILSICLVCLFVTVSLNACKNTDVLEEIIYNNDAAETDTDTEQISQSDTEEAEKDEDLKSEEQDEDTDREKEAQADSSVEGDADNDTENNASLQTSEDANTKQGASEKAAQSGNVSAGDDAAAGEESAGKTAASGSSGDEAADGDGAADGDETAAGGGTDAGDETAAGDDVSADTSETNEGSGQESGTETTASSRKDNDAEIIDANGDYVKIPSDVETVAAVGEVAVIVEMLGGDGRLVATSESLSDNELAQEVFDDLSDAAVLWEGDGTDGITSANFEILIETNPDVCLVTSGVSIFTDEQLAELDSLDIPVVTVYRMNIADNILNNVTLIGELLGSDSSDGKKNAVSMAKKYTQWYTKYLSQYKGTRFTDYTLTDYDNDVVYSDNSVRYLNAQGSGCYTLFIEYWDDTADVDIYSNTDIGLVTSWSGGAPATDSGYSNSPLSYYMSMAGVVNTAAAEAARLNVKTQYTWYVNGWSNNETVVYISGQYTDYKASNSTKGPYLARIRTNALENISTNIVGLGSDDFAAVVVANDEIRDKLEDSNLLKYYEKQTDGNYTYYGYEINGLRMESTVVGEYDIIVNPYGVSCWYEGSAEAPLEMMWTGYTFGTTSATESSLSDVISSFYETFYDYDLSDDQIEKILNGSYAQ